MLLTSRNGRSRADVVPALRAAGSGDALRETRRASDPRRLDRREPTPWAASPPPDAAGVACLDAEPRRAVRHFGRLNSAWKHSQNMNQRKFEWKHTEHRGGSRNQAMFVVDFDNNENSHAT